jgi:hypothetical protein
MTTTHDAATEVTVESIEGAFREALLLLLEEVFAQVHVIILDKGTSFFETLETVTAEEASRPISSQSASIAAQVNHTRFYIDGLLEVVRTGEQKPLDWAGSWQVGPVDEEQWHALLKDLRRAYDEVVDLARAFDQWDARAIGGAIALVAHSAYHLGEIRQGLGVIRG